LGIVFAKVAERQTLFQVTSNSSDRQTDIVVIGSGVGGLSCAALLARYGFDVIVCESHSIPGGAAHAF
jgi:ribulose 1,5-bisphosphate synthetase/thiazole synthase